MEISVNTQELQPASHGHLDGLVDQSRIPLHPVGLWTSPLQNVWVLPTVLDRGRVSEALQAISRLYPVICGRVRSTNSTLKWGGLVFRIELTGSSIPFETQTVSDDHMFASPAVIQSSLQPFIPAVPPDWHEYDGDTPRFIVRISTLLPSGRSVLGILWGHMLGDAAALCRFVHTLSTLYINPTSPIDMVPSFGPHVQLDVDRLDVETRKRHLTKALEPVPRSEAVKAYADSAKTSKMVQLLLTREELLAIRKDFAVKEERISDQDCITGWWVSLLRRAGMKADRVLYTIDFRSFTHRPPFIPRSLPSFCGNCIHFRGIDIEYAKRGIDVARTVRADLNFLREDPDEAKEWLSTAAYYLGNGMSEGQGQLLIPDDGEVIVNSNLRFDWIASFGEPREEVSYHCDRSFLHFLRVFAANPGAGGDFELTFSVAQTKEARIWQLFEEDRRRWRGM